MTQKLIDGEIIDGVYDDISMLQDDIDQQMNAVIAEFGDEEINATRLKIYKTIPNMGKMEWLFDCVPTELPIMERLKEEYGGGKYEARMYTGSPLKLKKKFEILIGHIKKQKIIQPTDNSDKMITVMMEGFNKLGELMVNVQKPTIDPMAAQMQMLQNMVAMKELMGIDKPTAQESPIKMMTQLVELQKLMGVGDSGGASSADVLLSMANTVLPKLAEMGEREQSLKSQQINQNSNRQIAPKKIPQKTSQNNPQENNPMKMHLIFLCQQARSKRDPKFYAKMVIENTDKNNIESLREFIGGPDSLQEMGKIYKSVLKYPEWFKKLGDEINEILNVNKPENKPTLTNNENKAINPEDTTLPGIAGTQTIAIITDTPAGKENTK